MNIFAIPGFIPPPPIGRPIRHGAGCGCAGCGCSIIIVLFIFILICFFAFLSY